MLSRSCVVVCLSLWYLNINVAAQTTTTAAPTAPISCVGVDAGSNDISTQFLASSSACWNWCTTTSACAFAVWAPDITQCWLKNSAALTEATNANSGRTLLLPATFTCPAVGNPIQPPVSCVGVDAGSNDISTQFLASSSACWNWCTTTSACAFAVWAPDITQCWLKNSAALTEATNANSGRTLLLPTQYTCPAAGTPIA